MNRIIVPASPDDLPLLFHLFERAIHYQRVNHYIGWSGYDQEFVKADVQNSLLYKMVEGQNVIGIFSVCHTDPLIWREREKGDALYLHRIVLNREFEGAKIFPTILQWAMEEAHIRQRTFVRMDTWAGNTKLINYYKSYGFRFVENYTTPDTSNLPVQHRNLHVALLEFTVAV
jgi:ribosomal protein S18 acetylase RimI-like enzyme